MKTSSYPLIVWYAVEWLASHPKAQSNPAMLLHRCKVMAVILDAELCAGCSHCPGGCLSDYREESARQFGYQAATEPSYIKHMIENVIDPEDLRD